MDKDVTASEHGSSPIGCADKVKGDILLRLNARLMWPNLLGNSNQDLINDLTDAVHEIKTLRLKLAAAAERP